jgi:HNH endonuclease
MPVLPIPNRCIWCLKSAAETTSDVSHVLPNCVGNVNQHLLPRGIVCTRCNNYFGTKVEPKLLEDPQFHIIAVALGLVDPDDMQRFRERIFDAKHPSEYPVKHDIKLKIDVHGPTGTIQTDIEYTVKGRIKRVYSLEDRRWLSRAVHKIAFESIAWSLYVQGHESPVDLFSHRFNAIRKWVREGHPQHTVRPVVRLLPTTVTPKWGNAIWNFPNNGMAVELSLFGDWYTVSVSSSHENALSDMKSWAGDRLQNNARDAWVIADSFERYLPLTTP